MLYEVWDHAGRPMIRSSAAYIIAAGRVNEQQASARDYAGTLYMHKPRTREAWRVWFAARHALRAEIMFYEVFA